MAPALELSRAVQLLGANCPTGARGGIDWIARKGPIHSNKKPEVAPVPSLRSVSSICVFARCSAGPDAGNSPASRSRTRDQHWPEPWLRQTLTIRSPVILARLSTAVSSSWPMLMATANWPHSSGIQQSELPPSRHFGMRSPFLARWAGGPVIPLTPNFSIGHHTTATLQDAARMQWNAEISEILGTGFSNEDFRQQRTRDARFG